MLIKGTCMACKEDGLVIDVTGTCLRCMSSVIFSVSVLQAAKKSLKELVNAQHGAIVKAPPENVKHVEHATFDLSAEYPDMVHVFGDAISRRCTPAPFEPCRAFGYATGANAVATSCERVVDVLGLNDLDEASEKPRECPGCGAAMGFVLFVLTNKDRDSHGLAKAWMDDRVEIRCCRCHDDMLRKM